MSAPASATRGGVLLDGRGSHRGVGDEPFESLGELIERAKREQRQEWGERGAALRREGLPSADRQYFRTAHAPIQVTAGTQITGTAEADLLASPTYLPLAANQLEVGNMIALSAWGVLTTPASAATSITITPRFGTTTGGTALGASAASATVGANQSAVPWFLEYCLTCRAVGTSGSVIGSGALTVPPGVLASNVVFGGIAVSVNTTVAAGIFIGATLGGSASFVATTSGIAFEFVT